MKHRPFRIRPAVATDVAAIYRLSRAIAREDLVWNDHPDSPPLIRRRLGPLAVVAEAKGGIVGYGWAVARPARFYRAAHFGKAGRVVELDAVYVAKRWRNGGIGTALVRRILQEGRRRGFRRFYVCTANKHLAGAIRFYRRTGFRTWNASLFI